MSLSLPFKLLPPPPPAQSYALLTNSLSPSSLHRNTTNSQHTPTPCFLHQSQPSAMTRWQPTQCPVCRRLLVHRAGAAIIHCPSCHSLLNLHAHPSTPGQTVCLNCTNIIHHPIGPPLLQCRICSATNSAPILHYICRVCSVYLAYSSTLTAVVCPICHNVEPPIDTQLSHIPLLLPLTHHAPPRPCPSLPPRHIPWLPSTPVRPVTTIQRSSPQLRTPQSQSSFPLSPPSSPLPSLPTSQPHPQAIPPVQMQHPPSAFTSHTDTLQHSVHFPTQTQPIVSTADKVSVNGADHDPNNKTHEDSAKPISQPLTLSPSPKAKQEQHFDTKD